MRKVLVQVLAHSVDFKAEKSARWNCGTLKGQEETQIDFCGFQKLQQSPSKHFKTLVWANLISYMPYICCIFSSVVFCSRTRTRIQTALFDNVTIALNRQVWRLGCRQRTVSVFWVSSEDFSAFNYYLVTADAEKMFVLGNNMLGSGYSWKLDSRRLGVVFSPLLEVITWECPSFTRVKIVHRHR